MRDPAENVLICANCGPQPPTDENPDDEWRAESDGVGELHAFCSECWRREFGSRDEATTTT